jgi:hypothetical protein
MLGAVPPDLCLHLEPGSDPISGSLTYPDGAERSFTGWIELTAALEEAHHGEFPEVVAHGREVGKEDSTEAAGKPAPRQEGPSPT